MIADQSGRSDSAQTSLLHVSISGSSGTEDSGIAQGLRVVMAILERCETTAPDQCI
jgi:hypothetical protein